MFHQKCSNKNVPSKMSKLYQQKCPNKSCQQKSSNKDFPTRIYNKAARISKNDFQQGFFNKDFSTRIKNPCWKILVKKSLLKNLVQGFCNNPWITILDFQKDVAKILLEMFHQKSFEQKCSNKMPTKMFQQKCSIKNVSTKITNKNVPTKMFHQKCSIKNVPTKVTNKNVPTKIFHQKCSIKNVPTKMFQQKLPTKIFQQGFSSKDFSTRIYNKATRISNNYFQQGFFLLQGFLILVEKSLLQNLCWKILVENPCWKSLLKKNPRIFQQGITTSIYNNDLQQGFLMFQQKCSIKNVPSKMFNQKFTNKNVPIKTLPTKMFQQKFSNKNVTTRQQGFFNKDFLTRIFYPCWQILVEKKSLFPCWKILVEKSWLKNPCSKILVGNPCWKIQGFFNKDFQQGFLMFQQKCSNKNVPTKICQQKSSNKDFSTRIYNKDVPTRISIRMMFQQKFFNKDVSTKMFH